MTRSTDKVTRFDSDLVDSAIAEGRRQQRTGRQQLEYWARVGRSITAHETGSLRRVEEAVAGDRPTADLGEAEGRVFNAEIRARLDDDLAAANYRQELAGRGVTTVSLDADGHLVEHRPDGTRRIVAE